MEEERAASLFLIFRGRRLIRREFPIEGFMQRYSRSFIIWDRNVFSGESHPLRARKGRSERAFKDVIS